MSTLGLRVNQSIYVYDGKPLGESWMPDASPNGSFEITDYWTLGLLMRGYGTLNATQGFVACLSFNRHCQNNYAYLMSNHFDLTGTALTAVTDSQLDQLISA